ncbi:unnamed protein product [Rotaria sp. Silwood2]|nr:unnamed protein product [Rotaria sp. Silwood2]
MSLQQFKEDQHKKVLKKQNISQTDIDINIRNQKTETVDSFTYLGCTITNDQRQDTEISIRLSKAAKAFNMLRHSVWHRKSVYITARLRIFRACILPVLLYGSETWSLTKKLEQSIVTFYNRWLHTIIGVNFRDRMPNETLLDITGQPTIENIIRRNRLRWFGHVNRAENRDGHPTLTKKTMFAYFHNEKRPCNMGRSNRWEDKVLKDIEELNIDNWRKMTLDISRWREAINQDVHIKPTHTNIKNIIHEYKQRAARRRKTEVAASTETTKGKVTEILAKENNQYKCPGCKKHFKPQGITNHIKACTQATTWCKKNNINYEHGEDDCKAPTRIDLGIV